MMNLQQMRPNGIRLIISKLLKVSTCFPCALSIKTKEKYLYGVRRLIGGNVHVIMDLKSHPTRRTKFDNFYRVHFYLRFINNNKNY